MVGAFVVVMLFTVIFFVVFPKQTPNIPSVRLSVIAEAKAAMVWDGAPIEQREFLMGSFSHKDYTREWMLSQHWNSIPWGCQVVITRKLANTEARAHWERSNQEQRAILLNAINRLNSNRNNVHGYSLLSKDWEHLPVIVQREIVTELAELENLEVEDSPLGRAMLRK